MVLGERSDGRIDREKTCPLLLRLFCGHCSHNKIYEYSRKSFPLNELQAYTWLDATLLELSSLVKIVNPDARKRGTIFDFAIVSPDPRSPGYKMRDIGSVCSGFPSDSDKIMLKDCAFRIGDMVDVAVTPPATERTSTGGGIGNGKRRVVRRNAEPIDNTSATTTGTFQAEQPPRRVVGRDHDSYHYYHPRQRRFM
ncbi:Histone deacetylase complex subunit SAP18 [Echinococcus granulosus]|uniref:18 kDa Sin3-associated polypeptide n=1 Tax=Echinococcus granulosus TaxID=6210 RepID=A0A068WPX4_ECHGR|nr:Histone deacetylase complex subunit SAP18 [Echinococcus granulosus]CDS20553.1 histone deacetylase complex subunit sap18 [Echinococcus granulosus]